MRLDQGVIEKARDVGGEKTAARLYNSIEHELALGGVDNEDDYDRGEQALHILEDRFPGIAQNAREVTDPPQLSRGAGKRLREEDHGPAPLEAAPKREHDVRRRRAGTTFRARAGSATAIHARRRGSTYGRRLAETGIPGAYDTTAEFVMRTIGAVVGLSFFYLLLTPRGSRAVNVASSGGVGALRALISPNVDPLNRSTWTAARASAIPATIPPASLTTRSAASVSAPGTAAHPNMFLAPLAAFPQTNTPLSPTVLKHKMAPGATPR